MLICRNCGTVNQDVDAEDVTRWKCGYCGQQALVRGVERVDANRDRNAALATGAAGAAIGALADGGVVGVALGFFFGFLTGATVDSS